VPGHSRSDCHGWSAHPTREFLATIFGITSAGPGFRAVTIAPHLGNLEWVSGAQAHPQGEIAVRFKRTSAGLEADIALPGDVAGTLHFQGRSRPIRGRFQGVI